LFFLAERTAGDGRSVSLLYGSATREDLVPTGDLESRGVRVRLSTEDGSSGTHGTTVDLLNDELPNSSDEHKQVYLAACGPEGMLRAIWDTIGSRRPRPRFEVSLEIRMACGMGACMGCTVFLADESGRRVCCEGPVFDGAEVFGR
jgi:dihydroorotate dehydrogenase electron transfer subunit